MNLATKGPRKPPYTLASRRRRNIEESHDLLTDAANRLTDMQNNYTALQKKFGQPRALTILLILLIGFGWWNWEELLKKPGMPEITDWIVAVSEYVVPSDRVLRFDTHFEKPDAGSADTRYWTRVGRRWEERTPEGIVNFHSFVRRMSLDGCQGDQTKKERDEKLEMFIPYKQCVDMSLNYRRDHGTWVPFGKMKNIK